MNDSPTELLENLADTVDTAWWEAVACSAAVVVPILHARLPWISSVVDIGCGTGAWGHEFELRGVSNVLGLDWRELPTQMLEIDSRNFRRVDLRDLTRLSGRQFDIALALDVARYLPDDSIKDFIVSLSNLSDIVLFSSPIPGETKDDGAHERWQSYWAALFNARGYHCLDILRRQLWYDQRVAWQYRQTILLFVHKSRADVIEALSAVKQPEYLPLDLVHPQCFEIYRNQPDLLAVMEGRSQSIRNLSKSLPDHVLIARAIRIEDRCMELETKCRAIEQSTSWTTLEPIRRYAAKFPIQRLIMRRTAKLLLWLVTKQFRRKIGEWRQSRNRLATDEGTLHKPRS